MKYILACLLFISSFAYGQECETFDTVRVNAVSLITSNSARVNGSISHIAPGQIVTIILKYVRVGQTDTVSNTGANPLRNLTGLQANTQYIYYYSTICTVGSVSQSVVYTFTTLTSTISYTPQFNNYQYPYIKFDSGMKVPRLPDTSRYRAPSTSGGDILFHRPDSIFYGYNGARWVPFTNSTSGLSNKVDSVTVYGDSLFYWINGVSYGWILPTQQDISHAGNGLTRHVDTVKLGGALTQTTSITNAGGYDFTLHLNEDNADNGFIGTNYGSFVGMNSGSPMMYQLNGGFIGEIAISSSLGSIISGVSSEIHHRSELFIRPDSVNINPYLGRLSIDTLTNVPGTHALRYNPSTGLVSYSDTTDAVSAITASKSVLKTGSDITLVNDSTSFSNDVKIYGYSDGVRGWKDGVITNLTNVQDGDILVWNSDSSYFENVVDNSRYRLLQFYVDQTNAPADGDSVFYQSTFSGKWVEVYRGGENQTYDDPLNGYEFDSGAATITFHPPLASNEKVKIYIYKEWPAIDTMETPIPAWADLDYPTQTGLTESPAHVWTGNPANAWNNFGLSGTNLPADGGYAVQYVATDGIMNIAGFNLSNTSEAYANYECGLFLSTGGTVLGMELGTPTGTLATLSVGDWARMHRVGSTIKIQTSTDKISWSDVHTFTFSSSATLYINLAVYNDGGTAGKCYNPQILIE